ncbi:MAG: RNA polymerase sigma factor [Proteobacteria bacterium]|nr:RNA polymerase sigma factor [Pseudomonadota bacterium]
MKDKLTQDFIKCLQEHKGIIYKVSSLYCGNLDFRQDLIQEITLQLWLSFKKYNPTFAQSTWVYTIALNSAISQWRKYRKHENNVRLDEAPLSELLIDESSQAEVSEEVGFLTQIIEKLSPMNKALIILYLDGYSHQDTSDIIGISPSNVSSRVSRIKKHIKQQFEKITSTSGE